MIDQIIPPEISNDAFSDILEFVAANKATQNILEIGSSSGTGSTAAFLRGLARNRTRINMFCVEISKVRFAALIENMKPYEYVKCYNGSTVEGREFPSASEVESFYCNTDNELKQYPLMDVLNWLDQDIEYLRSSAAMTGVIETIREDNNITNFDVVLIDGSEFTGMAEFRKIDGANVILLDDVRTYKCYHVRELLLSRTNYRLFAEDLTTRNGFSAFERN